MGTQFQRSHELVPVIHALRQRHIEHRPCWPVQSKPREFRIPHNAHNPKCAGILRKIHPEMPLHWVFAALEKAFHKRFVHDGHRRGCLVVRLCEIAAAHHGHAKILQIVRAHPVPRRSRFLVNFRQGMPGYQNRLAPIVCKRVVERQPRTLHPRQTIQPILELPIQRSQFRFCIAGRSIMQRNQNPPLQLKPEILVLQLVQTATQHRRSGNQHNRECSLHQQQRLPRERGSIACAAARSAQRIHRVGARSKPRWRGPKYDSRDQSQRKRKTQHHQRWPGTDRKKMRAMER